MAGVKTRQRKRQQSRRAAAAQKPVVPTIMAGENGEDDRLIRFDELSAEDQKQLAHLLAKANPDALVAGAVAVHHTQVVTGAWDGNAAMGRCSSAADYRSICAAYNSGTDLSQRQNWHLPHHSNPGGPANIAGVRNGLSRAPQTSSISAADRAGATAHLRAHLNDFNKRQGNNAVAGFDALSLEDALDVFDRRFGDLVGEDNEELAPKLPQGMTETPKGVGYCTMGGNPGYTGGGACHVHDGSEPGMKSAMGKAQADARKNNRAAVTASARPIGFDGIATIENKLSDDNSVAPRVILANSLSWQEMPVSFMAQTVTAEHHDGAEVAGRVDSFARKKGTGRMQNITTAGELTTPFGINEVAPMIENKTMRYVSVDLGASEWSLVNRKTFDVVPEGEFDIAEAMDGAYALGCTAAKIKGLTLVTTQAIEGAMVALTAAADQEGLAVEALPEIAMPAIIASGSWQAGEDEIVRVVIPADVAVGGEALVASGARWRPKAAWFEVAEPPGKMPLTVQKDGQIYGHLAPWDSCHATFLPSCVPPPRSPSNYGRFHTCYVDTAEGGEVNVGKLMFSAEGGHADTSLNPVRAAKYYDKTGMVAAVLRAVDGKFGIWVCGSLNPSLTATQREEMREQLRLYPPSGDWRPYPDGYDLLCGLAVSVPGFGVPNEGVKVTIVASADGVEPQGALIASAGWFDADPAALEALGLVDEEVEEANAERDIVEMAARAAAMVE